MNEKHQQILSEITNLLAAVESSTQAAAIARAAESVAEVKVLECVIELLAPHFDKLADTIIVRREEFYSEAQPSLNRFHRTDHPEPGVLLFEDKHEEGTGLPHRLRLWCRQLFLLKGGRLLIVETDGFREERKRRGLRPDRHEVWAANAKEVSPADAMERIVLVEAVLERVKEELDVVVGCAEDSVISSADRTAKLLKLLNLVN